MPLPLVMAKKSSKKRKSGAAGPREAVPAPTSTAAASPAAAPLGTRRGVRARVEKVSAKAQAALAKKAARANWHARMTAEGR